MDSLTTSQALSLVMVSMPQALERGQTEATRVRRIKWLLRVLAKLGAS